MATRNSTFLAIVCAITIANFALALETVPSSQACSADGSLQACPADGPSPTSSSPATWEGEFFPGIKPIQYEGPDSKNPLAFKYYNADEVVLGKSMRDWLRFSLSFWHTLRGDGSDPFGGPTKQWPWENAALDPLAMARRRLDVFFELVSKLGVHFWCFHDRDVSPWMDTLEETNAAFDTIAAYAQRLQREKGVSLLWGTAQLFAHRRFMHGAATSPNATVFAYAAAQVKKAMEVTHDLGGQGYVFWGGREGYLTLLNTDMALETANEARFLRMAAAHAKRLGFRGALMLEPKPQEPTKHQYSWDSATTRAFLLDNGLSTFKLNIECNHATLAGHSCFHELTYASDHGLLASVDANTGDPQVGWDTDQFMTDPAEATLVMAAIVKQGGLSPGGLNFDAKIRRESVDIEDLFIGHIAGMDAMARGLRNVAAMLEDGRLAAMKRDRYSSWEETKLGRDIVKEKVGFKELEMWALENADPGENIPSGKQELYEAIFHSFVR